MDLETFRSKIRVRGADECWYWTGTDNGVGYGAAHVVVGDVVYHTAHRAAYALAHGAIPARYDVMHRCDQRLCCNPRHLQAGTRSENMRDAVSKGRARRRGRVLTPDQAAEIKALLAAGVMTHKQIGARFGVNASHVGNIASGLCWVRVAPANDNATTTAREAA